ncbi:MULTISPECIES: alpha/beta hydrolase family protein [Paenibacillus]|uniref:alpha/beta hydrolase family protein n=1 Tax=Paenibacillus TaxID=44249 RepID=UPI0022B874AA|nr:prolyl oligopeptidase family serine peptidase [Paenibacillus caseinilyticus]MCZ8518518.1 prolyl oligopeptidase family serine peptidase [Paenibacillus caseinilyticus]
MLVSIMAALLFLAALLPGAQAAEAATWTEEEVSFASGTLTLHGTLLLPQTPGPHPAVVLVHGSSSGSREKYRGEAEMFAKAGIAALIYDKRSDGFGKLRSYDQLAADANAAVEALHAHQSLDPDHIGLWGLSEGAWVTSLAASRSEKPDFLITVGASGVPPVQQQSWQLVNRLRDQGVTSPSVTEALSDRAVKLAVSAGMFAEASYNPLQAFESLKQPVLAIWGRQDRIEPPLESSRLIREALERGGNAGYSLRFFDLAGHNLRSAPDGIRQTEDFAPGYAEAMTSWVLDVTAGRGTGPQTAGAAPVQEHMSQPGIDSYAWHQTAWVHLGVMLVLLAGFAGLAALWRRQRAVPSAAAGKGTQPPGRGAAQLAAGSGLLSVLGFAAYFGWLMSSGAKHVAPLAGDRPLVWLLLQAGSLVTCAAGAAFAWRAWQGRGRTRLKGRLLTLFTLAVFLLFVPWAFYWQMLLP